MRNEIVFSLRAYDTFATVPWLALLLLYGLVILALVVPSAGRPMRGWKIPFLGRRLGWKSLALVATVIVFSLIGSAVVQLGSHQAALAKGEYDEIDGCYRPPGETGRLLGTITDHFFVDIAERRFSPGGGLYGLYLLGDLRRAVADTGPLALAVKDGYIIQVETIGKPNVNDWDGCDETS